jgi:hypothetical protein
MYTLFDSVLGIESGKFGLDSSGSGWAPVAGPCECDNEPWDPMKGGELAD